MKGQEHPLVSYAHQLRLNAQCQLMELSGMGCSLPDCAHRPSAAVGALWGSGNLRWALTRCCLPSGLLQSTSPTLHL